jgi:hypothetical protein
MIVDQRRQQQLNQPSSHATMLGGSSTRRTKSMLQRRQRTLRGTLRGKPGSRSTRTLLEPLD